MPLLDVAIDLLQEHPRQAEFFAETSKDELEELAADLNSRGQQEVIHCTADFTIICGHQRVAAAKLLGWETIKATVRDDLGDAGSPDVINQLVADNVMRRQLDDLSLARCYRALKVTAAADSNHAKGGDLRDHLATRLGCGKSGRTLDRLERLLDLPIGLQHAISRGQITKQQGEKILKLPDAQQDEIVQAIEQGKGVKPVLRELGVIRPLQQKSNADLGCEFLNTLKLQVERLSGSLEELDKTQVRGADAVEVLDGAIRFLTRWGDRKARLRANSVHELSINNVGAARTNCPANTGK